MDGLGERRSESGSFLFLAAMTGPAAPPGPMSGGKFFLSGRTPCQVPDFQHLWLAVANPACRTYNEIFALIKANRLW